MSKGIVILWENKYPFPEKSRAVQVFTWSSYFKVVGKVLKRKVVQNKPYSNGGMQT
jgi:hypothetical protein